jgi:hypothetical protein
VFESGGGGVQVGREENVVEAGCGVTVDVVLTVWKSSGDEVIDRGGHSVWSEHSHDQHLLEWHLLELLPVKWKFLVFWRKLIVPVLESVWSLLLDILGELFETFNLDELLHGIPNKIWKPLLKWVRNIGSGWAVQEEVHLFVSVLNS